MRISRFIKLLCLMAFCFSLPIRACSCASNFENSRAHADVIFQGRIASRTMVLFGDAVFQVIRVWKGAVGDRFYVEWRNGQRGDCNGFWSDNLKAGAELVVFAKRGGDGVYRTNICFPTQLVARAKDVIGKLGVGRIPSNR